MATPWHCLLGLYPGKKLNLSRVCLCVCMCPCACVCVHMHVCAAEEACIKQEARGVWRGCSYCILCPWLSFHLHSEDGEGAVISKIRRGTISTTCLACLPLCIKQHRISEGGGGLNAKRLFLFFLLHFL